MPDVGIKYKLGCVKTPDRAIKAARPITRMAVAEAKLIPPVTTYRDAMTPVGDQGSEGTCVAFACIDGEHEYQEEVEHKKWVDLSVRHAYQEAKKIDGLPGEGTYIDTLMHVLKDIGVAPEYCWPYHANIVGVPVCKDIEAQASPYKIDDFWLITSGNVNIQAIKESLVANGPCVAAVEVYSNFYNAPDGEVPMPKPSDSYDGAHAICIVGYDDILKHLIFKNSWGTGWGDEGYGYLSYDFVQKYMFEAWSCRDKLGDIPTPPEPSFWDKVAAWFRGIWNWLTGNKGATPATFVSAKSGNWSDASTWKGGTIPLCPDLNLPPGCPECGELYEWQGNHWEPQCHC
jgi:hypothetical protein